LLLREYEQEINTKADEIELLRCRNSQLLRAYKQSQNRCVTLETQLELFESQVDHLRNDCISLEARVKTFRETNDTLKKSCDDAWSQSCTLSSQYLKMMSLALSLGKQNIDKERLWVAKEEEWERTHSKLALQLERRESEYVSADIYASQLETQKSNAVLPYPAPSPSQYSGAASIPNTIFSAQNANDDSESTPVESASYGARTSGSSLYGHDHT
jgi:chromosome segregation ATPase